MVHQNHDRRADDRMEARTVHRDSESILLTILRALAAVKDVPVTELDPLYDQIDLKPVVDVLTQTEDSETTVSVEFTIDSYTAIVSNNGTVCVHTGDPVLPEKAESS